MEWNQGNPIQNIDNPDLTHQGIEKITNTEEKGKRFQFLDQSGAFLVNEDQSSASDSFEGVLLSTNNTNSNAQFIFSNSTKFTLGSNQTLDRS